MKEEPKKGQLWSHRVLDMRFYFIISSEPYIRQNMFGSGSEYVKIYDVAFQTTYVQSIASMVDDKTRETGWMKHT
jgi:hypothetical protein